MRFLIVPPLSSMVAHPIRARRLTLGVAAIPASTVPTSYAAVAAAARPA
jgi:hypothetical protein